MAQRKPYRAVKAGKASSEHNLKIGEARTRLPDLVRTVEGSSDTYTIGQRGNPSAVLLSRKRVEPLLKPEIEPKLALVIVEQLLADAPLHLRTPAVDELSELSRNDLLKLLTISSLPLSKAEAGKLKKDLEHSEALDRLTGRFELAKAIARAHEAGLYEAAEHEASSA
jgi:PHD/YefM family antitoxin component YafN of YafNO toxin-antitoxin module